MKFLRKVQAQSKALATVEDFHIHIRERGIKGTVEDIIQYYGEIVHDLDDSQDNVEHDISILSSIVTKLKA